jgi:hypothetical protein
MSDVPQWFTVSPLTDAELLGCFGTLTPTGDQMSACATRVASGPDAGLRAYLRWRDANAGHRDVRAVQRRQRAQIRSEKGIHRASRLPKGSVALRDRRSRAP